MIGSPPNFEVPEQMRQFAEKSVDQARKAFDDFIGATQQAMSTADGSARSAQAGASDAGRQAVAYMEENVSATFDFAHRMVRARTVEEMAAIQQEFLRRQMEAVAGQGKGLGETFARSAEAATKPKR